jgi:hypothetical protein
VPGFVVRDLLLLRLGPWQFNVMGLYVVLVLVAPLLLAALRRAWSARAGAELGPVRAERRLADPLFGAQFEDPFPLLTWQVLFVTGSRSAGTACAAGLVRPSGRHGWGVSPWPSAAPRVHVCSPPAAAFRSNWLRRAPGPAAWAGDVRRPSTRTGSPAPPSTVGRLPRSVAAACSRHTRCYGVRAAARPGARPGSRPLGRSVALRLRPARCAEGAALLITTWPGLDPDSVALGTLAHGIVLAGPLAMVHKKVLVPCHPPLALHAHAAREDHDHRTPPQRRPPGRRPWTRQAGCRRSRDLHVLDTEPEGALRPDHPAGPAGCSPSTSAARDAARPGPAVVQCR